MGVLKGQEYELSLWKGSPTTGHEERIDTLSVGPSDQSSQAAYDLTLIENIDGTKEIEFKINRKYRDDRGIVKTNPLIAKLSNESKIKLRRGKAYDMFEDGEFIASRLKEVDYDERWVTYVIKDINEDSTTDVNTYLAKEVYVNELGKNGWSVTLDSKLENNYGTLTELAEFALAESDWQVGDSFEPTETQLENLFQVVLDKPLKAYSVLTKENRTILAGEIIYVRYGSVEDTEQGWQIKHNNELQFLYLGKEIEQSELDSDRTFIDEKFEFVFMTDGTIRPRHELQLMGLNGTPLMRAHFIVRKPVKHYHKTVDRYVEDYIVTMSGAQATELPVGTKVYKYNKTEYLTAGIVENKLSNTKNFISTIGWQPNQDTSTAPAPKVMSLPIKANINETITNYLSLKAGTYYNQGPTHADLTLETGEYYVVRYRGRVIKRNAEDYNNTISTSNQKGVYVELGYKHRDAWQPATNSAAIGLPTSKLNTDTTNIDEYGYPKRTKRRLPAGATSVPEVDEQGYAYVYLKANQDTNSILNKLELRIDVGGGVPAGYDYAFAEIQLFKYVRDSKGNPIFLGDIPTGEAIITPTYFIVKDNEEHALPSREEYYSPIYRSNYEGVRHIEVRESNYFNILQTLAELFEVWTSFHIKHCKDGTMWLDPKTNKLVKEVRFSRFSPTHKTNSVGFKYGVNLEGITRGSNSDNLATKVVVKDNNQQYAKDGICSIRRTKINPHGESEIYNFDYFIQQGMLDEGQVLADLYGSASSHFAYYPKLRKLNDQYNRAVEMNGAYKLEILRATSALETLEIYESAAYDNIESNKRLLDLVPKDSDRRKPFLEAISIAEGNLKGVLVERAHYEEVLKTYKDKLAKDEKNITKILAEKKLLKKAFYELYSPYLQEGSWVDEEYVDDELYYLDALTVSNQNAFPQVDYNINVIDLKGVVNYTEYDFQVGELTTIEDTDFFGWSSVNIPGAGRIKTPFKKEVVISEVRRNLDNPADVSITVQNYTKSFDDLFQRVNAAAIGLQYRQGEFSKANQIMDSDGSLKIQSLENAFKENAFQLSNANNQDVIWDEAGIEVRDRGNSSLLTRIIAGGLYLSSDGGRTWSAGVTGNGINTSLLTAGVINTNRINLMSGTDLRFRWDRDGITALDGDTENFSFDRYVRYNNLGLFGTNTGATLDDALAKAEDNNEALRAIRKYASWSLTWEGLRLQNTSGGVDLRPNSGLNIFNPIWKWTEEYLADPYKYRIDAEKHEMYQEGDFIPLVSLGKQYNSLDDNPFYGLRLRNKTGDITLTTDESGNVWVKDTLELGTRDKVRIKIPHQFDDDITTYTEEEYVKYIQLNGNPNQESEYYTSPMISVGDPNVEEAPFRVYGDGRVVLTNTDLTGDFTANSLKLLGELTVGTQAGINGENSNSEYVFWSGKGNGQPSWYVKPDGTMVAEKALINASGTFKGDIFADNGYFKGEINAKRGSIQGKLTFGDKASSYIGIDEAGYYLNIEDRFKVNTRGDIFSDSLNLVKNTAWSDENQIFTNIVIGNKEVPFQIFNPSTEIRQAERVFGVYKDGSLEMNGKLKSANDIILDGKLIMGDSNLVVDGKRGSISCKTPRSDGWGISGDGTAYFNNVDVRGTIKSSVFEQNHVSAVGGDLLVTPSVLLLRDIVNQGGNTFKVARSDGFTATWEYVDKISINVNNNVISDVSYDYNQQTITIPQTSMSLLPNNTIPKGAIITSTSTQTNSILLSAQQPKGGYIKVEGPKTGRRSTVVLGNLQNSLIPTERREKYFGDDLGYGLYADNAYLTGKLYLPNAGVTNEDILYQNSPIRMFAGTSPKTMTEAPFIVTQDGSLYATKATISGNIEAEDSIFSGYIVGTGVLLDNDISPNGRDNFFFSRNWENDEPSPLSYIMNITEDATEIWRGFDIYSHYWTENKHNLYGYSSQKSETWAMFKKMDTSPTSTYTPHMHTVAASIWHNKEKDSNILSLKLEDGALSLSQLSAKAATGMSQDDIDHALWDVTDDLKFGYIDNGSTLGIKTTSRFDFTDGENIALSILPSTNIRNNRENISVTKVQGIFGIGEDLEISVEEDAVVFNYIGL